MPIDLKQLESGAADAVQSAAKELQALGSKEGAELVLKLQEYAPSAAQWTAALQVAKQSGDTATAEAMQRNLSALAGDIVEKLGAAGALGQGITEQKVQAGLAMAAKFALAALVAV